MSYDLHVYCADPVSVPALHAALAAAKIKMVIDMPEDTDLVEHGGGLPLLLTRGRATSDACPEWYGKRQEPTEDPAKAIEAAGGTIPRTARKILQGAKLWYSLDLGDDDIEAAMGWALAAAAASVGNGVAHDPQGSEWADGEDEVEWYLPKAAWTEARRRLRELPKPGKPPKTREEAYIALRHRHGVYGPQLDREIEERRPGWALEELWDVYGGILGDEAAVRAALATRPPKSVEQLALLLDGAWHARQPAVCRLFADAAPEGAMEQHLIAAVQFVGFTARLYLPFLFEGLGPLPAALRERLLRAANPDLQDLVREIVR